MSQFKSTKNIFDWKFSLNNTCSWATNIKELFVNIGILDCIFNKVLCNSSTPENILLVNNCNKSEKEMYQNSKLSTYCRILGPLSHVYYVLSHHRRF